MYIYQMGKKGKLSEPPKLFIFSKLFFLKFYFFIYRNQKSCRGSPDSPIFPIYVFFSETIFSVFSLLSSLP